MSPLTATAPPQQDSPPGAYDRFIQDNRQGVRDFYDALGCQHLAWNQRFRYYRQRLYGLLRHCVPPGASVLDIGCGVGDVLDALEPRDGVGIDCSPVMVEQARKDHPGLTFAVGYGESLHETEVSEGPYEYITLVNVIGEMWDIAGALRNVHRYCSPETRIIIVQYNYLWEPICRLAAKLRLKLETPTPNWLSPGVLGDFLRLGGP